MTDTGSIINNILARKCVLLIQKKLNPVRKKLLPQLNGLDVKGVFVARDHDVLEFLDERKNIFLIDATGSGKGDVNVDFPESLTAISIAITTTLNKGGFDYLVFDSINDIGESGSVEKFSHFIVSKLRTMRKGCLLLARTEKSMEAVSAFCDETIKE